MADTIMYEITKDGLTFEVLDYKGLISCANTFIDNFSSNLFECFITIIIDDGELTLYSFKELEDKIKYNHITKCSITLIDRHYSHFKAIIIDTVNIKNFIISIKSPDQELTKSTITKVISTLNLQAVLDLLLLKVQNDDERDYLHEALLARNAGAYRGSIVIAWIAIMNHLYIKIDSDRESFIEWYKTSHQEKPIKINQIEDYQQANDNQIIEFLYNRRICDQGMRNQLKHYLNVRNDCAHVRKYALTIETVNAFFSEMIKLFD